MHAADESVRLSITMTIIRFVNGLLDPNQQSQFAIPLNVLAKKIGLPSWFVEFRHMGTHEQLPSREMCEECLKSAIQWTWDEYWCKLSVREDEGVVEVDTNGDETQEAQLKALFKQYRRIRRRNLNKFIKFGDSSDVGKEYWSCVHGIQQLNSLPAFYDVLIDRMVTVKLKFDQSKLLYEPLLIHLSKSPVVLHLIDSLLLKCYEYSKFQGIETKQGLNDQEHINATKWTDWLVLERYGWYGLAPLVDVIGKNVSVLNRSLLANLLNKLEIDSRGRVEGTVRRKIDERIKVMNEVLEAKPKRTLVEEDMDIFDDLESLKKRAKLQDGVVRVVKRFEECDTWVAKPFGVI